MGRRRVFPDRRWKVYIIYLIGSLGNSGSVALSGPNLPIATQQVLSNRHHLVLTRSTSALR